MHSGGTRPVTPETIREGDILRAAISERRIRWKVWGTSPGAAVSALELKISVPRPNNLRRFERL
jgi:hypothetical protein